MEAGGTTRVTAGGPGRQAAGRPRAGVSLLLVAVLAGCAVVPQPLDEGGRARLAAQSRREVFQGQEPIGGPLTLAQATARALRYHAETRQRQMEEAAAAAQLEVARYDLLPRLTANAGYSWRDNDAFGLGFTPAGTIATTPSASVERTHATATLGLNWSVLDFGVSYYRARQLADQKLIAEERRRKALQTLAHDVRVAWWRAEAAERLLPQAERLLADVDRAIERTRLIEARKLLSPVQTATLRRALLDLSQQIAFRRQDLAQAKIDLAALVNAPPGDALRIAGPASEARAIANLAVDPEALEELALAQRPELAEEGYRARISAAEARKALVGLLPNLSFDLTGNYDTNRFLVNNAWAGAAASVLLNLTKVFSLPALKRSEAAQRAADDARRQALAMAIVAQTHVAAMRYALVADEFLVWDEAARDDDLIVGYIASSERSGIDSELELVRARARSLASHINRDLSYANVQAAVARLYNSLGYDAVPRADEDRPLAEVAKLLEARHAELDRASFAAHVEPAPATVELGPVVGGEPQVAVLLREGVARVFETTRVKLVERAGDIRLELELRLEPPRDGRRPARLAIRALGIAGTPSREFRTVLSEPVDPEQWRAIGEGAAYRIVDELGHPRITRLKLRPAVRLGPLAAHDAATGSPAANPDEQQSGAPLALRLASELEIHP